jgi:ketosteroid isomerase-like protein
MLTILIALATAPVAAPAHPRSPKAVVHAMFESFNQHDARAMQALYAEDARLTSSDFCGPRGKQDIPRTYETLFRTFPDVQDSIETVVVERDMVAVKFVASSPTGKWRLTIHTFLKIKDGLIVSDDSVFDNGGRDCQP